MNEPKNNTPARPYPGKVVALIPARYAATRFPGKLMQPLGKKTVILHTYDNAMAMRLFDEVIVVTDSKLIYDEIVSHGGNAMISSRPHDSGSDRIAEAAENMNVEIIVNVQGDEPFLKKDPLEKLIAAFNDQGVTVASLMRQIPEEEARNPNNVKVVVDKSGNSLYFSRGLIPFPRDAHPRKFFLHVGVYAFRKKALLDFTRWPATDLEKIEKLEQLRLLENGVKIRMVETSSDNIAIDTPEDLARAHTHLQ